MKILHTVEFYSPSVGGAQEVVRQISERLVQRGHHVTVATTFHPDRSSKIINGVRVEAFEIAGNAVNGYVGDTERYQQFLINGDFDLMMNYAAQEWAMDLVFPILDQIPYCKVMIPCGFSGLYDPEYRDYFSAMPDVMRQYDHLIFHAEDYRDIDFARTHNIAHYSIIPNGASEIEFGRADRSFRKKYRIAHDVPLIITVGSHTSMKGHRLCLDAFERLDIPRAVLVIIGNIFPSSDQRKRYLETMWNSLRGRNLVRFIKLIGRAVLGGTAPGCLPDDRFHSWRINIRTIGAKRVLLLDPPRADVVAALQAADLFIFGSNVEYSPLVLYEAVASKTPFISLACGNAAEIASWTGGGIIAPTIQKEKGYVDGDVDVFANLISSMLKDEPKRHSMADKAYRIWQDRFTWIKIALKYEELYNFVLTQHLAKN